MKSHTESSLNGNSAAPTGEISFSHDNEPHDYEKLVVKPTRPAPAVPSQNQFNCSSSYQGDPLFRFVWKLTFSDVYDSKFEHFSIKGIQGIPFLLNTRLEASSRSLLVCNSFFTCILFRKISLANLFIVFFFFLLVFQASLPSVQIKTKEDIEKEVCSVKYTIGVIDV